MSNKVIWITGGSSGIGKATAYKFANEGWQVALSARREELLNEISESNNNIHPFPLDVLDSEKCKEVFKKILSKYENIDIALFSTGIHDPKSERKLNLENIREIMETNFFGTINSINSVYNYFKEKKSGHVSIVSSVAGYRGLPAGGAYCASKAALINYAESLYFDMKRFNVRVSIVNPGFIKTPMTDQNNFPMPMIATAEFAAEEIFKGLTKSNSFEIHFPKKFTFIMKLLRIMPNWLYLKLLKKGMSLIGR